MTTVFRHLVAALACAGFIVTMLTVAPATLVLASIGGIIKLVAYLPLIGEPEFRNEAEDLRGMWKDIHLYPADVVQGVARIWRHYTGNAD